MSKKIFAILMILVIFVCANSSLFTVKKADAIPVTVLSDLPRDVADRIAVAVWKAAVYPLIRDMVINFVTTGDFKVSWNSIKDWLFHQLLFQTANAVFEQFLGVNLCFTVGASIKIALLQMYQEYPPPLCTFDQSQVAQLTEKLVQGNTEEAWQDVRNYYYANFHTSLYGVNNSFGAWWQMRDNIDTQIKQSQANIRFEMMINEGMLGSYDCSTQKPGQVFPDGCRVNSLGMTTAELIKSSFRDPMDSTLKAQMINDLAALAGVVTDMVKNKFIYSIYDNL